MTQKIKNKCIACNSTGTLLKGMDTEFADILVPINPKVGKTAYIIFGILSLGMFNALVVPFILYALYLVTVPSKKQWEEYQKSLEKAKQVIFCSNCGAKLTPV